MRSRWSTYLLLTAVVAIWGTVAWKIAIPRTDIITDSYPQDSSPVTEVFAADTLQLDYPDPFLKESARPQVVKPSVAHENSAVTLARLPREQLDVTHLGTVVFLGKRLYILKIDNVQYEIFNGDTAGEYSLIAYDRDSLYLRKNGVVYGVKLCE